MFVATHVPLPELPKVPGKDKTLHVVAYLLLAVALMLTLVAHGRWPRRRVVAVMAALAVYGAVDELTQGFVKRCPAFGDWLADLVGVVLGMALVEAVLCFRARKRRIENKEVR